MGEQRTNSLACGTSRSPHLGPPRRRSPTPGSECEGLGEQIRRGRDRRSRTARHQQPDTYSFYNTENDTGSTDDSESEYRDEGQEMEDVEAEPNEDTIDELQQSFECETEAQKRKERRHAKKVRDREGDRRRPEGLPRNDLLVDEYSKTPYGVGVNDWRKEVMLLSRKLDLAIGMINRQPHDALEGIVEWIQHTWEYNNPIKFEAVKVVIARGVSLRRTELWKKIPNNEPKPEDVSDRTWRSLKRELQNPATVRKSQNCSRANASWVNFGRTGPSGEVGVGQRLRKRLRRSPDPEEIQFEMARDKGYGGCSKRKNIQDNLMHGSENAITMPLEVATVSNICRDTNENRSGNAEYQQGAGGSGVLMRDSNGSRSNPETLNHRYGGGSSITEAVLASNPFVMKLMERLAALEGRKSSVPVTGTAGTTEGMPVAAANITDVLDVPIDGGGTQSEAVESAQGANDEQALEHGVIVESTHTVQQYQAKQVCESARK